MNSSFIKTGKEWLSRREDARSVKTVKNFFLYSALLVVLVLSTSSVSNVQRSGGRNIGDDQVPAAESQSRKQECGNDRHNDFGAVGSGDETDGLANDLNCGSGFVASASNHELVSILLFGTALIGAGVAVRRLRF